MPLRRERAADLDAGILNKRITIQATTETPDGRGGFTEAWSDIGTCWADIRPLFAKQIFEYRSLNVHATHQIKVRASVDVDEDNRILYGTRIFEILTIENEAEAEVVKWLVCKEVRN